MLVGENAELIVEQSGAYGRLHNAAVRFGHSTNKLAQLPHRSQSTRHRMAVEPMMRGGM